MNETLTDISELDFDTGDVTCDRCTIPAQLRIVMTCGRRGLGCHRCWVEFYLDSLNHKGAACRCGWFGPILDHHEALPL